MRGLGIRWRLGGECAPCMATRARVFACGLALLLLLVLALTACSSSAKVPPRPTPTPTATPSPTPSPTATRVPGPQPAAQPLGPPPSSCPPSPQPDTMSFPDGFGTYGSGVRLMGKDIVWIPEPSFPTVAHLESRGYTQWPALSIVWELGPDATDAVSVQATNIQTGAVLWWIHGAPPDLSSQTLTLDADVPGPATYAGIPEKGWQQFESSLLIPQAGCYALDATWAGGSWHMTFSAGA